MPTHLHTTAATARATLTSLCGAMFTVTGIVFSTTTVALSITSAQLGPRLLRNFLGQLVTQLTLGICLATSVYCLILLRYVDKFDGDVFVPHLSLLLASGLGLLTLVAIIYFIHRVAHSMQAQNVASDVADDLDESIERLFPERIGSSAAAEDDPDQKQDWQKAWARFDDEPSDVVTAAGDGYLQAIDDTSLMLVATRRDGTLRLRARPGDYVREGQPLVDAQPGNSLTDADKSLLRRSFLLGNLRTTQQDVECAINELVEIALRALSPGVNDPFTAITCIDRLSGALRRLAIRQAPPGLRYKDEKLRVVVRPRTFRSIVDATFDQLRQNATGNVAVVARLLESIAAIGPDINREGDRKALLRQVEMTIIDARKAGLIQADLDDLEQRYHEACEALGAEPQEPESDS